MKKLLLLGLSLALSSTAFAYTEIREINTSSFTTTNDTNQWIQASTNVYAGQTATTGPNTDFRGVIVGSPTAGGVLTVFDSQGSATNKIATISLAVANEFHYNVRLSSGLSYTTTSNSGGVTIIYHVN